MKYIKTEGIILNFITVNEKNKLAFFLTPDLGKIAVLVPSANSLKNRFSYVIEKTNHLVLDLYKTQKGFLLTEFRLLQSFKEIKKSLPLIVGAEISLEIIDKTLPMEESSPQIFNILKNFLNEINKQKKSKVLLEEFKIKLLYELGILSFNRLPLKSYKNSELNNLSRLLNEHISNYCGTTLNYQKILSTKH